MSVCEDLLACEDRAAFPSWGSSAAANFLMLLYMFIGALADILAVLAFAFHDSPSRGSSAARNIPLLPMAIGALADVLGAVGFTGHAIDRLLRDHASARNIILWPVCESVAGVSFIALTLDPPRILLLVRGPAAAAAAASASKTSSSGVPTAPTATTERRHRSGPLAVPMVVVRRVSCRRRHEGRRALNWDFWGRRGPGWEKGGKVRFEIWFLAEVNKRDVAI